MNIFKKAIEESKYRSLPDEYDPVKRGHVEVIKTKDITDVWIDEQQYSLSLFKTGVTLIQDPELFRYFIHQNFLDITLIVTQNTINKKTFSLKRGYLHNDHHFAWLKQTTNGRFLDGIYYLNGREIEDHIFILKLRESKLKRILNSKSV